MDSVINATVTEKQMYITNDECKDDEIVCVRVVKLGSQNLANALNVGYP